MATINGIATWGIVPSENDSSSLATMSWNYRDNYLISANNQLRYQVQWFFGSINEATEASALNAVVNGSGVTTAGDVINVVFKIESSVDDVYWNTIGTIKKTRDITNRRYNNGLPPVGHRFTVDVSQLISDQLSYSLCPINKGTWQSNYYGGMNGGLEMQDNVIGGNLALGNPISDYNVSDNGTFRRLKVSATFEIIDINGNIINASTLLGNPTIITTINSVNQFERDSVYYQVYNIDKYTGYNFLTRCPNWNGGGVIEDFKKPVRMDEQAEWLQFYMRRGTQDDISGTGVDTVSGIGMEINTYIGNTLENTFYLIDFQDNVLEEIVSSLARVKEYQNQTFIQNISPDYINSTAVLKSPSSSARSASKIANNWNNYSGSKITASTTRYTAHLVKVGLLSPYTIIPVSQYYEYTIDRENKNIPYGFVRFHWLNSMGGTDSYTAKRDIVEGLSISRDVIERKSSDRTWYQADSGANGGSELDVDPANYISNTMRGGNIYKGGREVSTVNAERVQSVYTEPLNISVAKWLEEITLSPNVWIEMETDATKRGNTVDEYQRPSTKEYIPVIINNSEIETVNQENGLVKFNIEYTLSHKVQTQRN